MRFAGGDEVVPGQCGDGRLVLSLQLLSLPVV